MFLKVDLSNTSLLKSSKNCDFGPNVQSVIHQLSDEDQTMLRREFREALVAMIKYLVSHLPLQNKLLKQLTYTDPNFLDGAKFSTAFVNVAKMSGRFSNEELIKLCDQLVLVKLSVSSNPPQFDENVDSYDSFWLKKVLMNAQKYHAGEEFLELKKVVKMISILPNSQGFVERGFNTTKRIADSRENVSENLMKASKVVLDHMRLVGGPSNVTISSELLKAHQSAHLNYQIRRREEKRKEELEAVNQRRLKETENKKRKFEEENASWESKVEKLKSEIKVLQESLKNEEEKHDTALSDASKYENKTKKDAAIKSAMLSAENNKKIRRELGAKQESLAKLMSKKPKM